MQIHMSLLQVRSIHIHPAPLFIAIASKLGYITPSQVSDLKLPRSGYSREYIQYRVSRYRLFVSQVGRMKVETPTVCHHLSHPPLLAAQCFPSHLDTLSSFDASTPVP
jgi:hypothetical protein